ncbi:MAG: hypothetical protein ABL949_13090 [Fimbriimonadaceae bacterium]
MIALLIYATTLSYHNPLSPASFRSWDICYSDNGDLAIGKADGFRGRLIAKNAWSPKWSPDRQRILFARDDGAYVISLNGKDEKRILKTPTRPTGLSWGKPLMPERVYEDDGTQWENLEGSILVTYDSEIKHIMVQEGKYLEAEDWSGIINPIGDAWLFCPAISPDGTKVAVSVNGDVWLAETEPREQGESSFDGGWEFTRIAALAEYDQPSYRASRENYFVTDLDWSPDGKSLAFCKRRVGGSGFEQIGLLSSTKSRPWEWQAKILNNYGITVSFSPDGQWLFNGGGVNMYAQSVTAHRKIQIRL